jgi:glutathione S-transferase
VSVFDAGGAGNIAAPGGLPVLYSFRRCPFAMRARLALATSWQRCELREVVLRDKPAALIAASPKATVPVLVLPDGTVLDQSLDIMRWALARHDPEQWLAQTPDESDRMDALIARCDGEFKRDLDRYKYPNRYVKAEEGALAPTEADMAAFAEAHRAAGATFLTDLDGLLSDAAGPAGTNATGAGRPSPRPGVSGDVPAPGLVGGRWSLADAAILPFVRQFAATDPAWFDAQPWTALHGWLGSFITSPRLSAVMDKYPRWEDGTPGLAFPA